MQRPAKAASLTHLCLFLWLFCETAEARTNSKSESLACDETCGVILMTAIAAALNLFFLCFVSMWCFSYKKTESFRKACDVAENDVLLDTENTTGGQPIISFSRSRFMATILDQGREVTETGVLVFEGGLPECDGMIPNDMEQKRRLISGKGSSDSGSYRIVKGEVSIYSGKAFWIQQETNGEGQSLVRGRFVREQGKLMFLGHLLYRSGVVEEFNQFDLIPRDEENGKFAADESGRTLMVDESGRTFTVDESARTMDDDHRIDRRAALVPTPSKIDFDS